MSKSPAFQFYPDDFIRDTMELSLAARGAWITLLCKMWYAPERGRLSMPLEGYSRMLGTTIVQTNAVLDELSTLHVALRVTERNKNITLINRRMHRESESRKSNKIRQKRFREKSNEEYNGESNVKITPPSSSSSSSSISSISSYVTKTSPEREIFLGKLISGVKSELGLKKLGHATEAKWLSHGDLAFENGFSVTEFLECFSELRRRHSYQILPNYVTDQLPDFVKSRRKIQTLPSPQQVLAEAEANNAFIKAPPTTITEGIQ